MGLRLVLAEDSYLVREGLRMVLEAAGHDVLATADDLDGLLREVRGHVPDVVVTDVRMPPTRSDEGIRAARVIREEFSQIGVVVLSQYLEPEYALHLFEHGSSGVAYLLKERVGDLGELEAAIDAVRQGGSVVDPMVVDSLVAGRMERERSSLHDLSPREVEVLAAIAKGASNAAIAEALVLSQRAVEKHISSIFTKLGLLPESATNRRVRAVLLYLAEHD